MDRLLRRTIECQAVLKFYADRRQTIGSSARMTRRGGAIDRSAGSDGPHQNKAPSA